MHLAYEIAKWASLMTVVGVFIGAVRAWHNESLPQDPDPEEIPAWVNGKKTSKSKEKA